MKKNWITVFLLLLVTSIILFITLKPVFQHPNSILFSKSGDAQKSYFNFSYYLKYDDGIKHDGINYPYGDHLQYINSHPLYVQVLKFVDAKIYPVSNYGVGILNLSMLLSLILTVPFLFLILRKYSLPRWYSAIFAILFLFLSPQFDRIHGHFEMVYAFFIPMYWYLLIRWKEGNKRLLWSSLLIVSGLIGGFTSAYYAAFFTILLLGVLFVELWNNRKKMGVYWKSGLYLFAIAIIPLLIVKGVVSATDWITDRPNNPYGFYVYHANFLSVFLPFISPLKSILGNFVDMNFQWEGRSYVGLPATLLAVSIFITGFYNLFSKKRANWKIFLPEKKIAVFFYASILILLFSMCIPFKYGFDFLLKIVPPVKQFRALGRFTWIFYYIFTVYSAYFFYRLYRFLRLKGMALAGTIIIIFVIGYGSIDAGTNIKRSTRGLLNKNDKFESNDKEYLARFKEAKVNPDEFQGIFFLPFASTCGDKLLFEHGMNSFSDAMKCSYHTGIPLIQSFSPRLSYSQALSSIQMLANPAIEKSRLKDMNEKPILLVCTKEKMNSKEAWLQSKGEVFWEDKYITLSKLPLSVFHNSHQQWLEMAANKIATLKSSGNISTDVNFASIIFNGFDNGKAKHIFSGKGAFYKKKGELEILNEQIKGNQTSGKYELSFWLYVDSRKFDMPKATVKITDGNGKKNFEKRLNTREVHNVYTNWIRVSQVVDLKTGDTIQLSIKGDYMSVDNLLLKPVDSNTLIKVSEEMEMFNNFTYSR